jgi:hypothetical protein
MLRHVSFSAANCSTLLQLGVLKKLVIALKTDRRCDRFTQEKLLWVYQVIGLFTSIYDAIDDFAVVCRHRLPVSLLDLIAIYSNDIGVQSAIAKSLAVLFARADCVEVVEDGDPTPLFILMSSPVAKITSLAAAAIANAMHLSQIFADSVASLPPPFGVYSICEALKVSPPIDHQVSLLRCLAKASETPAGIQAIQLFLQFIEPLVFIEMDVLENWSPEQLIVTNALIILKNLAIVAPAKAIQCLRGKMNLLMQFMILEYVIELMRVLMRTEDGREVCREVESVEEIRLFLRAEND